jgi:pantetheine-phosphate adenylyltransferase
MFKHAAVGGTFDRLHAGHKALLELAFSVADKVFIGVTCDEMARKKKNGHNVQSFRERVEAIGLFLKERGFLERAEISRIYDIYGGAEKNPLLEVLVVSEEPAVLKNAREINAERMKNGLKPLAIATQPLIRDAQGRVISSSSQR